MAHPAAAEQVQVSSLPSPHANSHIFLSPQLLAHPHTRSKPHPALLTKTLRLAFLPEGSARPTVTQYKEDLKRNLAEKEGGGDWEDEEEEYTQEDVKAFVRDVALVRALCLAGIFSE